MAGEWRMYHIGEIADVIGGGTPSTKNPANFDGSIPWLTPRDLARPHRRYAGRGERSLSELGLKNSSARLLPPEAVLLTTRAPVGYVAIAANPIATNQGFRSLVLKPGFSPGFVYYWLTANGEELQRHASGSTFAELSGSNLKKIEIRVPPLSEQRAIAHILGTLDDKIELNRRMSETLEAIARALFKSWFVDFDPVRAKMEGRDRGLPKDIADLFPDRLVESELGEIPEGWEVCPLGDLVRTVKGRSYKSTELEESDTALVTLKSFARGGGYRLDGLKAFTGAYKPEQTVTPGETLIACTDVTQAAEVIGRPAMVRPSAKYTRLVASLDTVIVRPLDQRITPAFVYLLCRTGSFAEHAYAHTTGTTVLHLAKDAVRSFLVVMPPTNVMSRFNQAASCLLNRAEMAELAAEGLVSLRDTLLPKLISGELRVPDAEGVLARADG